MRDRIHGLIFAQKTDQGLKRDENEDACGFRTPDPGTPEASLGSLFLVADGIGSIGNGAEASQIAVETVLSTYYDPELDDDDPRERLIAAIQDAHEVVLARARTLNAALGTTLAGVLILSSRKAYLFNVGDSRVYRLRDGVLEQLTVDDSAVDARTMGPPKLTAYLGQGQPIVPNLFVHDLRPDDSLLLCSDGLWNLVPPPEIAPVVQKHTPEHAIDLLLQTVYARGARDNITITIIRPEKRVSRARLALALLLLVVLLGLWVIIQPLISVRDTDPTRPMTLSSVAHASQQVVPTMAATQGQIVIHTPDV